MDKAKEELMEQAHSNSTRARIMRGNDTKLKRALRRWEKRMNDDARAMDEWAELGFTGGFPYNPTGDYGTLVEQEDDDS